MRAEILLVFGVTDNLHQTIGDFVGMRITSRGFLEQRKSLRPIFLA